MDKQAILDWVKDELEHSDYFNLAEFEQFLTAQEGEPMSCVTMRELNETLKKQVGEMDRHENQIAKRKFPDMFQALLEYRNPKKLNHYRELGNLIDETFWEWYENSWLDKDGE